MTLRQIQAVFLFENITWFTAQKRISSTLRPAMAGSPGVACGVPFPRRKVFCRSPGRIRNWIANKVQILILSVYNGWYGVSYSAVFGTRRPGYPDHRFSEGVSAPVPVVSQSGELGAGSGDCGDRVAVYALWCLSGCLPSEGISEGNILLGSEVPSVWRMRGIVSDRSQADSRSTDDVGRSGPGGCQRPDFF